MHLAPFFEDRAVDAISREDVADLVAALERKELAPKTIRNIIGTLSALMNFARRRRWASSNPCDGAELPAIPDATEIRFLTLAQVERSRPTRARASSRRSTPPCTARAP